MELVAHTSALILDLRECRGGSPEGAAMWCSYFFPDDQVHLNDIYERSTGSTRQYWTASHLPAPRYLDRPVYVLTSAITFSGGRTWRTPCRRTGGPFSSARRPGVVLTRPPGTR